MRSMMNVLPSALLQQQLERLSMSGSSIRNIAPEDFDDDSFEGRQEDRKENHDYDDDDDDCISEHLSTDDETCSFILNEEIQIDVSFWGKFGVMELSTVLYDDEKPEKKRFRRRFKKAQAQLSTEGGLQQFSPEVQKQISVLERRVRKDSNQELVLAVRGRTVVLLRQTPMSLMETQKLFQFSSILDRFYSAALETSRELQLAAEIDRQGSKQKSMRIFQLAKRSLSLPERSSRSGELTLAERSSLSRSPRRNSPHRRSPVRSSLR